MYFLDAPFVYDSEDVALSGTVRDGEESSGVAFFLGV